MKMGIDSAPDLGAILIELPGSKALCQPIREAGVISGIGLGGAESCTAIYLIGGQPGQAERQGLYVTMTPEGARSFAAALMISAALIEAAAEGGEPPPPPVTH